MTEREKMIRGEPYDSRDPQLLELYYAARRLMRQLTSIDPADLDQREQLLAALLGQKGDGVWIETPFFCDYGINISIGEYSFINFNCVMLDACPITIGHNALIAPNVQIYTATHPVNARSRLPQQSKDEQPRYISTAKPVSIGHNVWIGGNTVIFPGVSIGNNVTIGAGSVVTRDLPDDVLAFGNPCQVRKHFHDE